MLKDVEKADAACRAFLKEAFASGSLRQEELQAPRVRILICRNQEIIGIESLIGGDSALDSLNAQMIFKNPADGIKLFIRELCGSQHGDFLRAVRCQRLFQGGGRFLNSPSPCSLLKLASLLHPGDSQSVWSINGVVGVSSLITNPVSVYIPVVSGLQALHAPIVIPRIKTRVVVDFNIAAPAASRADGICAAQEPDAAFETEIAVRQGADRADIGDIAGIGIGKLDTRENVYFAAMSPVHHPQFRGLGNLARKTDAASTQDAALLIENDMRTDWIGLFPPRFVLIVARIVPAVVHVIVLEFTFSGLIAYGTVDRMIRKQKFQHKTPVAKGSRGSGSHNHAFGNRGRAGGLQFGRLFDFHKAHAAAAHNGQSAVIAITRYVNPNAFRRFDNERSLGNLNFLIVNGESYIFRHDHLSSSALSAVAVCGWDSLFARGVPRTLHTSESVSDWDVRQSGFQTYPTLRAPASRRSPTRV